MDSEFVMPMVGVEIEEAEVRQWLKQPGDTVKQGDLLVAIGTPKVDSAVVRLTPREDAPAPELLAALERVTQAAFGQRRKMLRSSLKSLGGEALCAAAGVDPGLRAEAVGIEGFLGLARATRA